MLSRKAKASFYALAGPAMKINGVLYRHLRVPRKGSLKVHLGPGQKNYIDGWINVDANMFTAKCDIWADLRNPLPFAPDTVLAMYSHHVIEHLPRIEQHLRDVFRCLKPGGVYRVGGPNGDQAVAKFMQNDSRWFSDFPDKRESIGGRLENFIFCRGEHLTLLTYSYLEEMLTRVGFAQIRRHMPVRETGFPELFAECLAKEEESDFDAPHTLLVEAVKPPGSIGPGAV